MEGGAQARITVNVEYQNRRQRIGAERRLKSDFFNINNFLEEIRVTFEGIIPSSFVLQLWQKQNGSSFVRITSDEDLKNTIRRCRRKELVIFAEQARSEVDVRHLKGRVEDLEGEVVTLKEENRGLRELVDGLKRRLGVYEYIENHQAQQGAVEDVSESAGGQSSSVFADIKIKSESEELLD